jgi:5-formyltetrahydrofolate cyclo-ligase
MDIHSEKRLLRQTILTARRQLTPDVRQMYSRRIAQRTIQWLRTAATFSMKQSLTILSYMNLPDEVDMQAVNEWCWQQKFRVIVPRIHDDQVGKLDLLEVNEQTVWTINRYGIREPLTNEGMLAEQEAITIALIPGVAYDANGVRLGFGGGYYDRLKQRLEGAILIAPAFEMQMCERVPREEHDLKVHKIFTEERLVDTGK